MKSSKSIEQEIVLPASAKDLYRAYVTPKIHSAFTGHKVNISTSGKFSAFDGMLSGQILHRIPGKLIIQRWRGSHWKKTDPDSVLVLRFSDTKKGGRLQLSHIGVPEHDRSGVNKGWKKYYWKPWRKFLRTAY